MNALSLCAGIGGIDLGLHAAVPGYRTVCYVEIEPYCQDLLLARMAGGVLDRAPIWGDLRRFDGRPWRGLVDLIHGGYPCQPFSTAGKRRGADDRRHLWPHIAGIVEAVEPEWCFFENVAGHLSLGCAEVVRDLGRMGYRVALGLFTASELGAPHRRERLFILGHADALGQASTRQVRDAGAEGPGGGSAEVGRTPGIATVDYLRPWPPDRTDPGWREVLAVDPSLSPSVEEGGQPRLNPAFVEWLMGFPRGWTEGPSRDARLRMLGNAVVPAVAALAWCELSVALECRARASEEVPEAHENPDIRR